MEHKIGDIITLPDGRKAEVVEFDHPYCGECVYHVTPRGCSNPIRKENSPASACGALSRTDHKNIIYKEIKEE